MRTQGYSHRMIRRIKVLPGGLLKNGQPARMVDSALPGDTLTVTLPEDSGGLKECGIEVPVVYEDEDVLVYNKPPGLAVHPCRDYQEETLANVYVRDMRERGLENPVFRPVYRLDKDTDGLIVIAKNGFSAAGLSGNIQKIYTAIALGKVLPETGTIDAPIAQLEPHRMKRGIRPDGQRAVTHYETIFGNEYYTVLRIRLETGRTHQIRVHFASVGHPLLGDSLYGENGGSIPENPALSGTSRQALTCTEVSFVSPGTGKHCKLCINMHPEFEKLIYNV